MTSELKLVGVLVQRVIIGERTHVHLVAQEIPGEWLTMHGWNNTRLRSKAVEWWDVVIDGLRMRFELAWADLLDDGRFRLRFSAATPNHAAVALAHRVGQVARDVKIKRGPVGNQVTLEERVAKEARPKRVTVEGLPDPSRESLARETS